MSDDAIFFKDQALLFQQKWEQAEAEIAFLKGAALEQTKAEIAFLKAELANLKRMIFGAKSERFIPSVPPSQLGLGLDLEAMETPAPTQTEVLTAPRKNTITTPVEKQTPVRAALPAHLQREVIIIEPIENTEGLKKIGEEITEVLEYVEPSLKVLQYRRPKYAKSGGEGILIGTLPSRTIEKGIAGEGLLTRMVIDKYVDHLPLYRQIERFKRLNVAISSSTASDWIASTCKLLEPLFDVLKQQVLSASYLQGDETPIKVLSKDKKGSAHRGYYWVYHDLCEKMALFDYREGRGREGPEEILKNFNGYLQTDGYTAYTNLTTQGKITLLCCWAHARRYFEQALDNDKARAEYALEIIAELYQIERELDQQNDPEQIVKIREQLSAPLLEKFKAWLIPNGNETLPKSPIGKAINYTLERWDKLIVFLSDPILKPDNNLVENIIRPVALGRKNYLFAGSHEAATRSGMLYSFMATCKLNNINPEIWLKEILTVLPDKRQSELINLLPGNWKQKTS
jgi:transposase